MKILMRTPIKIVPGKMAEYMQAEKERAAISKRLGTPEEKLYMMISGPGDRANTIVYEMEWDSLAEVETFYEKMMADPESQALQAKYSGLIESHGLELYTPMP